MKSNKKIIIITNRHSSLFYNEQSCTYRVIIGLEKIFD